MSGFFVAGVESKRGRGEQAYGELREPFCVHTEDGGKDHLARVNHPVYSVTEFS